MTCSELAHPGAVPRHGRAGKEAIRAGEVVPDRRLAAVLAALPGAVARRLPRAAGDQPQPVHVLLPPPAPGRQRLRRRRLAAPRRSSRSPAGASSPTRSPGRGRAARPPRTTCASPRSCSPTPRSAPSTSCSSTSRATTSSGYATPGTVDVVEFMTTRRYSHVMHLESTVVGDLRPGGTAYDVLVATFPAGTLCGAPKPRAMALIDEYEACGAACTAASSATSTSTATSTWPSRSARRSSRTASPTSRPAPASSPTRCRSSSSRRRSTRRRRSSARSRRRGVCVRPSCRRRRRGLASRVVGVVTSGSPSKRAVSVAVAVPALVLLLATTRTWITGRSTEPLLGGGAVSATGSQVAPGVVALALVCLVALVDDAHRAVRSSGACRPSCSSSRRRRSVALTVAPLTDPEQALGRVAAAGLGRTGVVRTTAEVSGWAWTALVASVVLFLASLLAAVAAGRWSGLSSRFEVPVDESGDAPPVGEPRADPGRDRPRHAPHDVGRAQRGPRPDPGPGGPVPGRGGPGGPAYPVDGAGLDPRPHRRAAGSLPERPLT